VELMLFASPLRTHRTGRARQRQPGARSCL